MIWRKVFTSIWSAWVLFFFFSPFSSNMMGGTCHDLGVASSQPRTSPWTLFFHLTSHCKKYYRYGRNSASVASASDALSTDALARETSPSVILPCFITTARCILSWKYREIKYEKGNYSELRSLCLLSQLFAQPIRNYCMFPDQMFSYI